MTIVQVGRQSIISSEFYNHFPEAQLRPAAHPHNTNHSYRSLHGADSIPIHIVVGHDQ